MTTYMPENVINRYVWEQFKTQAPDFYTAYPKTVNGADLIPFFPAGVGNIPPEIIEDGLPYIVFDKFTKVRTGKYKYFYPIKSDQMRYTIYGGSLPQYSTFSAEGSYSFASTPGSSFDRYGFTIALTSLITSILDREDSAARDINDFAGSLPDYKDGNPLFRYNFHCINVFQSGYAESQQDVSNLMEYRPSRDLIIKYDYHSVQYNETTNPQ
jgi:hypothetical protein